MSDTHKTLLFLISVAAASVLTTLFLGCGGEPETETRTIIRTVPLRMPNTSTSTPDFFREKDLVCWHVIGSDWDCNHRPVGQEWCLLDEKQVWYLTSWREAHTSERCHAYQRFCATSTTP